MNEDNAMGQILAYREAARYVRGKAERSWGWWTAARLARVACDFERQAEELEHDLAAGAFRASVGDPNCGTFNVRGVASYSALAR